MDQKGAFGLLQTALQGAIQLRLEKTVNGVVAFMLGLIAVGLSKIDDGIAQWTMIILGGAAMFVGVISLGIVALHPSTPTPPVKKPAQKAILQPSLGLKNAQDASPIKPRPDV